jgi:hypothetical protein
VTPVDGTYIRHKRDFTDQKPRKALGIVRPMISPDAKTIALPLWAISISMPVGGKPRNITNDAAFDADPAWSPDGSQLVYSPTRRAGCCN